jgi:hypothetical protein
MRLIHHHAVRRSAQATNKSRLRARRRFYQRAVQRAPDSSKRTRRALSAEFETPPVVIMQKPTGPIGAFVRRLVSFMPKVTSTIEFDSQSVRATPEVGAIRLVS